MNSFTTWFIENIQLPPSPYPLLLSIFLGLLVASEATYFHPGSALFKVLASLSFLTAGISLLDDGGTSGGSAGTSLHSLATVIGLQFSFLGDIFLIPSPVAYYSITPSTVTTSKARIAEDSLTPEAKSDTVEDHEASEVRFKLGIFFFAVTHILYIVSCISCASNRRPNGTSFIETLRNPELFNPTYFTLSFTFCLFVADFLGMLQNAKTGSQSRTLTIPNDIQPLVKIYVGVIAMMVSIATATDEGMQRIVGAWLFMFSDLCVAVDVFGSKAPASRSNWGRPGWRLRSVGWALYFWAQMIFAGTV